jgi:hypothetical protein
MHCQAAQIRDSDIDSCPRAVRGSISDYVERGLMTVQTRRRGPCHSTNSYQLNDWDLARTDRELQPEVVERICQD